MPSELAFRAQLILREQRDLYDYWRLCAGARGMPSRDDIDPVEIPNILPGLSIIDAEDGVDAARYRLAGTRVRQIYGIEVTGSLVFDLDFRKKYNYWHTAYRQVIEDGLPMQGAVRGPLAHREHLMLFWLRLPLGGPSGRVEKILGYDAALPSTMSFARAGDFTVHDEAEAR